MEGIEVKLLNPATAADPLKIVGAGKVNIAMNYLPDVMVAREAGVPVVSIATTLRPLADRVLRLARVQDHGS